MILIMTISITFSLSTGNVLSLRSAPASAPRARKEKLAEQHAPVEDRDQAGRSSRRSFWRVHAWTGESSADLPAKGETLYCYNIGYNVDSGRPAPRGPDGSHHQQTFSKGENE